MIADASPTRPASHRCRCLCRCLRHDVRRLAASWTLHRWGLGAQGTLEVCCADLLVGRDPVAGTVLELGADGVLDVRSRCGPPLVHVRDEQALELVPSAGGSQGTVRVTAGQAVLVPSFALLDQAPAVMAVLPTLLVDEGVGRSRDLANETAVDDLLAASPAAAVAVLVRDRDGSSETP